MASKEAKDAVNELGRFFGVRSVDTYLSAIVGEAGDQLDPLAGASKLNPRSALISAITDSGDSSFATTKALLKYTEENEEALANTQKDVCITPDSADGVDKDKHPLNLPAGKYKEQGLGKPSGDFYTIKDLDIAGTARKGDVGDTKLSVLQVFPATAGVASADADIAALFFTSIPTLEMSRAVPYIDILTITSEGLGGHSTKLPQLSLGKWLIDSTKGEVEGLHTAKFTSKGSSEKFSPVAAMEIFTTPQTLVNVPGEQFTTDPFRPLMSLESISFNVVGTGGMFSYKSGNMKIKLHDKANLDKIAPLIKPNKLGTTGFSITYGWSHPDGKSIGRAGDAESNRIGELIDAAKITEIYQVRNSALSFSENGEVSIDLQIAMLGADAVQRADITLAKVMQLSTQLNNKFKAIQEHITKLRSSTIAGVPAISDNETLDTMSNLNSALNVDPKKLYKLLSTLKSAANAKGSSADIKAINKELSGLFSVRHTKRKPASTKAGKRTKARKESFTLRHKGDLEKLFTSREKAIEQMFKTIKYTPDPWLRKGHGCPDTLYGKTFDELKNTKIGGRKGVIQTHVSLGKLMAVFIGQSLKTTGQFSEIQLVFHAFNDSASYMHDYNMSQFPIEISEVERVLKEKFSLQGKMLISTFTTIISDYFISDPAATAYGMNSLYDDSSKKGSTVEAKANRQLNKKALRYQKKGLLNNKLRTIWAKAYGLSGDSSVGIDYRQPKIAAKIQTAPARSSVIEDPENKPDPSKTILKIQIFDRQCRSTESLKQMFDAFADSGIVFGIKRARSSDTRGSLHQENFTNQLKFLEDDLEIIQKIDIKKDDIDGDAEIKDRIMAYAKDAYILSRDGESGFKNLKESLSGITPFLVWGSGAGSLLSAKLSTQNDPALSTVNMLRQPSNAGDEETFGLPMTILPTQLSIDSLGCPFVSFGQQYFVDMGTNTTADNFYAVVGASHTLSPGNFKTSLSLVQLDAFGRFNSPYESAAKLQLSGYLAAAEQKERAKKK